MKSTDISIVASLASSKNLPVLDNIKITSSGIISTDLDILIKRIEVIDIKEDILVPSKELKARGIEGAIQAHESIKLNEIDDYPVFEFGQNVTNVKLTSDVVDHLIKASTHASTDETRPVLTAIWLDGDGQEVTITATDSYRLYSMKLPLKFEGKINIPASMIKLLKRTRDTDWTMSYNDKYIVFANDNWYIRAVLVAGQVPDWKKLIPKEAKTRVSLSVDQLKNIAKLKPQGGAITIFTDSIEYKNQSDNYEQVPNSAKTEQGQREVELGAVKVIMPLKDPKEGAIVSLNIKYILEMADTKYINLYVGENWHDPVLVEG